MTPLIPNCDCYKRPGFSDATVPFHRDDCPRWQAIQASLRLGAKEGGPKP